MSGISRLSIVRKFCKGFALVEILVAITVVGIALPALMMRIQTINNTTMRIEERTTAYWVAENKMQELIAQQMLRPKSVSRMREDQDTVEFDGRDWYWHITVTEMPLGELLRPAKMFRIEMEVSIADGSSDPKVLASLLGFIHEDN